ncbi:MAG: hypothetical protein R3E89_06275 [Thiolinea sp.]
MEAEFVEVIEVIPAELVRIIEEAIGETASAGSSTSENTRRTLSQGKRKPKKLRKRPWKTKKEEKKKVKRSEG